MMHWSAGRSIFFSQPMTSLSIVGQILNDLDKNNQSGQDLAEYGLLVGFIAVVVAFAVGLLGDALLKVYTDIVARWPF